MDTPVLDRGKERAAGDQALKNSPKAAISFSDLEKHYKLFYKLLDKLISTKIGKKILGWHKIHLKYLIMVLAAVERMEGVEEHVDAIQSNLDDYVQASQELFRVLDDIPSSPFEGMNKMALIVMSPALKENPVLGEIFNKLVRAYQETVSTGLQSAAASADEGRQMEADTKGKAQELLQKLSAMEANSAIDRVLIESYKKKVQFIQLDVMTRIQNTRSRADDYTKRMNEIEKTASQIKLITR